MRLATALLLAVGCATPGTGSGTGTGTPTGTPGGTSGTTGPGQTVRILHWNIESLGSPGTIQYDALVDVLVRLDADVVGLNEVDEFELSDLRGLAADLGYDTVVLADTNPFGGLRNAMLARVPVTASAIHTSAALSGDNQANDVTRWPVSVTLPSGIQVVSNHCKSGFEDIDEFRRTVDAIRMAQAGAGSDLVVVMGDINQEIDEAQDLPETFTSIPAGAPGDYFLGGDLWDELTGPGLHNGPFPRWEQMGLTVVEARQLDGSLATRDSSGRRIDYMLVGAALVDRVAGIEIYDARDDGMAGGLPLAGEPPDRLVTASASDHFPLIMDLYLP